MKRGRRWRVSPYDYVRRTYGVDPVIGTRVRHTVTGGFGIIMPEPATHGHYVAVRFDQRGAMFCHPTELDYAPVAGDQPEDASHGA